MTKEGVTYELPIDADLLNDIHKNHYAVVDDFLPEQFANTLLDDAERLYNDGDGTKFQQHYFQFGGALLKKPNVFELDLSDPDKLDTYNDLESWKDVVCDVGPAFLQRIDELDKQQCIANANHNGSSSSSLSLQTNKPPAIKLQINTGGGSFPW